ncbi:hypothetical protein HHK36_021805 [Tetracentron sinense]|uniref:GBF-interacting protein 1 N-terminal domain-containing protein n=1 Tax=Tetracentron sinense TaxID=13715 RepID=A0A834YXQ6_TETSI|nr:hypothetical protein HHK36_021805 [Tetracentron sinense]
MVSGSRFDGGTQVFSASVRKTIQSIKEIVVNHSDADIYAMLKETNMDPNETTQKLLNEDPFHEVKRKKDKKKENTGYKGSMEQSKHTEHIGQGVKSHAFSDRNVQKRGYGRNALTDAGISREFRIVRDNRVNQNKNRETMHASVQCSTSYNEQVISNVSGKRYIYLVSVFSKLTVLLLLLAVIHNTFEFGTLPCIAETVYNHEISCVAGLIESEIQAWMDREIVKNLLKSHQGSVDEDEKVKLLTQFERGIASSSTGLSYDQKHSGARNSDGQKSSHNLNGPSYSRPRHARYANSSVVHRKALLEEMPAMVPNSVSQEQGLNPLDSQPYSTTLVSNIPVDGLYSSSSDPVHVPSPDSRSPGIVGAIRREVGVVGGRRQSSENSTKHSSTPSSSSSYPSLGKDNSASTESFRPSSAISKNNQLSRTNVPESVMSSTHVSRSFLSNQYNGKPHQQLAGHQKAPQPNMEWKPKSSKKSSLISPGLIGNATTPISPPMDESRELKTEAAQLPVKLSRVNIFENHHVIIPQHLRVPEAERTRLTFGSFGVGFDSTQRFASGSQALGSEDESNGELSASASVSASVASSEDASGGNQIDLLDDEIRNSGSGSLASAAASEHPLPSTKESSSSQDFENYVHIGLARNDSPSYTPSEPQQQHDLSRLPNFPAYDSQAGYSIPFMKQAMDGYVRGQGLPPQEALSSHAMNIFPASSVPMVQQPVAQLYPQVHVSHFANVMPYRQLLSPVYVPPMAMPGYSSNPGYPHPSNGSNYLLMPGGSSQLTASGLKYGTQQFKPIPAGSPTGFGNYTSPAGYAINTPGAVGSATGLEDSTRFKFKEGNLYIPNPQAETSEIWIQNPRELPGLQSSPYYNIPGQAQPSAYLPSHTGHASFNAAAAQSAHMQFPGLYHHPPQPATIGNPHHMVPNMGGNVGVGVAAAAPGPQVGAYQQPQLGHLNWTTNF